MAWGFKEKPIVVKLALLLALERTEEDWTRDEKRTDVALM